MPVEPALKTVRYRGGLVTLRIPAAWVEENSREGGAVYAAKGVETPYLGLETMTMEGPTTTPEEFLKRIGRVGIERRTDGSAIACLDQHVEDLGKPGRIRRWEIAQVIPPNHVRLVIFTWAVLESQLQHASIQAEGELVDREIRAAVLAPVLGIRGR